MDGKGYQDRQIKTSVGSHPFKKGNPGKPKGATNRIICSQKKLNKITRLLENLALRGSPWASRLLLDFACEKPKSTVIVETETTNVEVEIEIKDISQDSIQTTATSNPEPIPQIEQTIPSICGGQRSGEIVYRSTGLTSEESAQL